MMKTYDYYLKKVGEVGYVQSVLHSMVYASGLPKARVMELVVTETGQRGIIQSLQQEYVEILMLDGRPVRHGTAIARTNEILEIPVGEELLGRSIDPFVNPIDGKGPFRKLKKTEQFESPAPPISKRVVITEPFATGVSVVDLLVPLGRGQRELVIGDAKSGKTAFLLQTIVAQAALGTLCIYVAIGQKKDHIKRTEGVFNQLSQSQNIILVAADASAPASFIYLVPFTGMAIAEYFRNTGREVLIVFDNLNTHAKLYREIALLSKKTPGREAYPGDIFFLHSHLVERAGNIKIGDGKTASVTLLATVETTGSDLTGYIQTNAMSMTDGHIFFDSNIFHQGVRPAVNIMLSVSRVGHQTQSKLARSFSDRIRLVLTEFNHAQNYARFGVELTQKTRDALDIGDKVMEVFQQDQTIIVPKALQYVYFGLLFGGFWTGVKAQVIREEKELIAQAYLAQTFSSFLPHLEQAQTVDDYVSLLMPYMRNQFTQVVKRQISEKSQPQGPSQPGQSKQPPIKPTKQVRPPVAGKVKPSLFERLRHKGGKNN